MELTDPNGLGDSDLEHRIVFRFPLASVLAGMWSSNER